MMKLKELLVDLWQMKELIIIGILLWGALIYGLFDGGHITYG